MYRLQSVSLVIDYLEHSLIAADWVLLFMTIGECVQSQVSYSASIFLPHFLH